MVPEHIPDIMAFEKSLEKIPLKGILALQVLLAQRALRLSIEPPKETIIKPKNILHG